MPMERGWGANMGGLMTRTPTARRGSGQPNFDMGRRERDLGLDVLPRPGHTFRLPTERWPSGRRRLIRNQVYRKVTWVRLPLSPQLSWEPSKGSQTLPRSGYGGQSPPPPTRWMGTTKVESKTE